MAAVAQFFATRQFRAGNSQAVRIPASMAFPPKTELLVCREGDKLIIKPKEETLAGLPELLAEWGKHHTGLRPEFEAEQRNGS